MLLVERLESRRLLTVSIAGAVFSDDNNDRLRQPVEVGLAGQQVYLDLQGDGSYQAGDPVATTDGNGAFGFAGLPAGNYLIRLRSVRTGYSQTIPEIRWGGFYYVSLADGQAATGKDFGEHPDGLTLPSTAAVAGHIFSDLNSNGIEDSLDGPVTGQQVYLDLQGLGYFVNSDPIVTTGSTGNYQFANLTAGNYIVRLLNVPVDEILTTPIPNYGGFFWVPLAAGQNVSGKNFGLHLPDVAPAAPDNVVLTVTNDKPVTVSFKDNANSETGFLIERATAVNGPFTSLVTLLASNGIGSTVTYADNTTLPLTTYYYRVTAIGNNGNSLPSAVKSIATGAISAPAAPSNLVLTVPTDIPVTISFRDNATNETGFVIQRGNTATGPFSTIATLSNSPASGATVSFVDNTTAASTTYYYRVLATGVSANSAYTPVGSVTTRTVTVGPPVPLLPGSWNLKLNENFDAIDSNIWSNRYWWNGNAGTEATFSPSQVSASGGILNLTASRQNTVATTGVTNPYVSGLLTSGGIQGSKAPGFTFKYGYVETRSKMAPGLGMWSALWMLPADYADDFELDMFENLGRTPTTAQSFYHFGSTFYAAITPSADLTAAFHTYGVDWEPDHITWYLDGVALHTFTSVPLIINRPMYLILNLDVGGPWAGPLSASSPTSSTWQVDYIRVWQH